MDFICEAVSVVDFIIKGSIRLINSSDFVSGIFFDGVNE